MKKQSGITIISLVVTIIVLIILAGVSINLLLGQNGIITKAKEATENMELAVNKEQIQLDELYSQMSGTSDGSISYDEIEKLIEFKKIIASAITDMGVATSENSNADTMANNIRNISAGTASNIRYNQETDMIQIFYNDEWIDWGVGVNTSINLITLPASSWDLVNATYANNTFTSTGTTSTTHSIITTTNSYAITNNRHTLTIVGSIATYPTTNYPVIIEVLDSDGNVINEYRNNSSNSSNPYTAKSISTSIDLSGCIGTNIKVRIKIEHRGTSDGYVSYSKFTQLTLN